MLTRMRAVNQPDVSPLRSQNGGARHKKSLSTSKFYCLAQPQAGDASVPGLKYCGAPVRGKAPVKDNVINLPFTAIALPRWCRWAADEKGRRQPTG